LYFDSAYIAKFYINEPESLAIRALVRSTGGIKSSSLAIAEVQCTFHRWTREAALSGRIAAALARAFEQDANDGLWTFLPVRDSMLWRVGSLVSSLPADVFVRAGDALHLMTAKESGEPDVWTNDRHMLAAAPRFGLVGRKV